jgi:hypothetical protein
MHARDTRCAIDRTVVDDDDLNLIVHILELGDRHFFQHVVNALRFIESWNDYE